MYVSAAFASLLWRMALALCAVLWLSPSHGHMRLGEITMVRDVSGQMTLDEVNRARPEPYAPPYLRFLDRSIVWLRLPLEPEPSADAALRSPSAASEQSAGQTLRVLAAFATQAQIYDAWPVEHGGEASVSIDLKPHAMHQTFSLPIKSSAAPRALWLRVQPGGPLMISVGLLSPAQRGVIESTGLVFHGLVSGLFGAFFMLSVAALTLERSALMTAWAAKQSGNLVVALLNVQWVVDGQMTLTYLLTPTTGWEFLRYLNPVFSLSFFYVLLRQFSGPRWAVRLHQVLFLSMGIALAAFLLGNVPLARSIASAYYGVGCVVMAITAVACALKVQTMDRPGAAPRNLIVALGVGLVFGLAWLSCFPIGFYKLVSIGPTLFVLLSAFTSTAFVLMLVWRQRNQTVERQAAAELQSRLAAAALRLERDERERQQEFMVMLTHELKAPLSTLGMVLQSKGGNPTMRHHADNALGTMRRVIDHCAKAIRLEHSDPSSVRQPCSLAVQLQLRIDALPPHERSRIRIDAVAALPDLPADLDALTVVLSNLLDNALKYSPKDSPIHAVVGGHHDGKTRYQTLTVANQPLPGPLPQPELLFSKYYRGEGRSRVGGSGLGLYLSRALALRMQGDLECSLAAHEVRFTLTLPQ